jgi:hypothetical protein
MNFIIFNVILLFAGFLAVLIFSVGLMACIAPIALFAKSESPPKLFTLPFLGIAGIYQIYFWGFWSAFCVAVTIKFTHKPEVTWNWLYWIAGFIWCTSLIGWLASKEKQSSQSNEEARGIQKGTRLYSLIAIVAFLGFSFFPSLILPPYGWALKAFGLQGYIGTKDTGNDVIAKSERSHALKSGTEKALCKTTIMSFIKAHRMMSDDKGRVVQLSSGEEAQMKNLIRAGLSAASSVSDAYLRGIHPDLPKEFREHLVNGWRLYLDGLESSEPEKQIEAIQLIQRWEAFKGKNADLLYESLIR